MSPDRDRWSVTWLDFHSPVRVMERARDAGNDLPIRVTHNHRPAIRDGAAIVKPGGTVGTRRRRNGSPASSLSTPHIGTQEEREGEEGGRGVGREGERERGREGGREGERGRERDSERKRLVLSE